MESLTVQSIICLLFVTETISFPLDNKNQTVTGDFQPVPLPTDFGTYDLNGNGYIDLKELALVSDTTHEEAKKPFVDADADDDDQISPSEFEKAPWSLQGRIDEEVSDENTKEETMMDDLEDEDQGFIINEDSEDLLTEKGEPVVGGEEEEYLKESLEIQEEPDEDLNEEPLEDNDENSPDLEESEIEITDEDDANDENEGRDDEDGEEEDDNEDDDDNMDLSDDILRETGVVLEGDVMENKID